MLSAGSEIAPEERKRTLDYYIRGITRDGSRCIQQLRLLAQGYKSISGECCFTNFRHRILPPQAQHNQVRSSSDKARGCTGDSNQKDLVVTLFFISSATFIEPCYELMLRNTAVNRTGSAPVLGRGASQFSSENTPGTANHQWKRVTEKGGPCGCRPPLCVWQRGLSSLGVREDVPKELTVLIVGCAVSWLWCAASLAVARGL